MAVIKKIILSVLTLAVAAVSLALTGVLLVSVLLLRGDANSNAKADAAQLAIMDRYDMYINNQLSNAMDGIVVIDRVYWLNDDDPIAPEPDQSKFGTTGDPATLGWLLEDAAKIMDGQKLLFGTDTPIAPKSEVMYYLDDTIFAVTWKQPMGNVMYTISEVKIAHPSQFRRFLAGGTYGAPIQLTTTEMAAGVNAVVASSGDFYAFRRLGVVVYDGTVQRTDSEKVETCYINDQGDLLFSRKGELMDIESAQAFVDANNIRFSLAFGPILIENGEASKIGQYSLGEIHDHYSRAALCQMDSLHYLLIAANGEIPYTSTPTIFELQQQLMKFGCQQAYTLDGGQTAVIAMNDQLINNVVYGYQRDISDIIYFATAIPDGQ